MATVSSSLAALLRRNADPSRQWVEQAVFGTTDPDRIAGLVARSVQAEVGVPVVGGTFYTASSGCVVGLRLADAGDMVCKAYQPHWEPAFLQATQRVQRALHRDGFPCPDPRAGPFRLARGWATLESVLADPGLHQPDADDGSLQRSAVGLVRLTTTAATAGLATDRLTTEGLGRHPFRTAPGDLYPTPHSPIFDFGRTAGGAEWIDEIARAAGAARDRADLPPVIAHLDWSARNVRLDRTGIAAVYDWDSLSLTPLAVAAGQAAVTWRATGEAEDTVAPDRREIGRYLSTVGAARGAELSDLELACARAAATWVMAYTARCEHALEGRVPNPPDRARRWLRTQ